MACLTLPKGTLARALTAPRAGATHFQMESQSAVLSFPRKQESRGSTMTYWMPAFAGIQAAAMIDGALLWRERRSARGSGRGADAP